MNRLHPGLLLLGFVLILGTAAAITIDSSGDTGGSCTAEPGGCTLRAAIELASTTGATPITIDVNSTALPPGTTISLGSPLNLTGMENLTLNGGGLQLTLAIDSVPAFFQGNNTFGIEISNLVLNSTFNADGFQLTAPQQWTLEEITADLVGEAIDATTPNDVYVANLTTTGANWAFYATGPGDQVTIVDSLIQNGPGGLWMSGQTNLRLDNVTLDGVFSPIQLRQSPDAWLHEIQVLNHAGTNGIFASESNGLWIEQYNFDAVEASDAALATFSSDNTTVWGATIDGPASYAIVPSFTENSTFANVQVTNTDYGILSSAGSRNLTVQDSTFQVILESAIDASSAVDAIFHNNTFERTYVAPYHLNVYGTRITVTDNTFLGGDAGAKISSAQNAVVEGNHFSNYTFYALSLYNTGSTEPTRVVANTFADNRDGINTWNIMNMDVLGNEFRDNADTAILLVDSSVVTIRDNLFLRNGLDFTSHAMDLQSSGDGPTTEQVFIFENTWEGNYGGIDLDAFSNGSPTKPSLLSAEGVAGIITAYIPALLDAPVGFDLYESQECAFDREQGNTHMLSDALAAGSDIATIDGLDLTPGAWYTLTYSTADGTSTFSDCVQAGLDAAIEGPTRGYRGRTLAFSDASFGSPAFWYWSIYPEGSETELASGVGPTFSFAFPQTGTYEVFLDACASDQETCDYAHHEISIRNRPKPTPPPVEPTPEEPVDPEPEPTTPPEPPTEPTPSPVPGTGPGVNLGTKLQAFFGSPESGIHLYIEEEEGVFVEQTGDVDGPRFVRYEGSHDSSRVRIVLIPEEGEPQILGSGEGFWWTAEEQPDGPYLLVAEYLAEGEIMPSQMGARRISEYPVLVHVPRHDAGEVATSIAVAGGAGIISVILAQLLQALIAGGQETAIGLSEDITKDRKFGRLARIQAAILRTPSIIALVLAGLLMAAFFALEWVDTLNWADYRAVLPVVGITAATLLLMDFAMEAALARASGAGVKVRILLSGTISLIASSLLTRMAIGYPGYIEETEDREVTPGESGMRALAAIAALLSILGGFVLVGMWNFNVFLVAMDVAGAAILVSSVPAKPLPGWDLWKWNKAASILTFLLALTYFVNLQLSWLDVRYLYWIGVGGLAFYVAAIFLLRRGTKKPETAA